MPEHSLLARIQPVHVRRLWVLYWIALFCIMHTPKRHLPDVRVSNIDKAVHITGYALLALLGGAYAQRRGEAIGAGWYVKWLAIYAVYAAVDEITQPLINRTASVDDWLFDITGVVIALIVIRCSKPPTRPAELH